MNARVTVLQAGPGVTVQDLGRSGYLDVGLSRGGATDRLALHEGAALLGQSADHAALEMAGGGGAFVADSDLRIALTGAQMRARMDGQALAWNAVHQWPAGTQLALGPMSSGTYGYLHIGGGFDTEVVLGGRATHLTAGVGRPVVNGMGLPIGPDAGGPTGLMFDADDRFSGGTIRFVASFQTDLFAPSELDRLQQTEFRRSFQANRMGVRLEADGKGVQVAGGRTVLSEIIVPGDIQITGDGTPYVLLADCQTTGGYPRIGTVIPCDLPRVAQAPAGSKLRLQNVSLKEALEAEAKALSRAQAIRRSLRPIIRDPHDMPDLLSYQLIGGVTAGDAD